MGRRVSVSVGAFDKTGLKLAELELDGWLDAGKDGEALVEVGCSVTVG